MQPLQGGSLDRHAPVAETFSILQLNSDLPFLDREPIQKGRLGSVRANILFAQDDDALIQLTKGMTEKTLTIDQPGLVDVEIHSLDKLVVQLEVR